MQRNRQSNESNGVGRNGFFAASDTLQLRVSIAGGTDVARKFCWKNLRVTTIETYNLNEGGRRGGGGKENSSLVQNTMLLFKKSMNGERSLSLFIGNNWKE